MKLTSESFEQLYFTCSGRLMNYASRYLGESMKRDCIDMVHDCFVSFWEHYKGREIENPEGLLFTTVRNRCLDSIRKRCPDNTLLERHIRDVSTDLLYAQCFLSDTADYKTVYEELESIYNNAVDNLSPRCREIFLLSRRDNLSNKEIALKLGISIKTVEKNITKALSVLRATLPAIAALLFLFK
ncbi:RNA polymerase sigma-70 factor [Alistipes shahii]|uniref:RNA polymerase sigma-70 factor n=1 Tax=Alistipes shahii TaxID=328814 RepID=UPI0021D135DE|nr:RNA polymerase sigma-70 factor [Alistipes shahii]MDY4929779.1 RNA polymerase sigma-70 factor [Alistipes shahii]